MRSSWKIPFFIKNKLISKQKLIKTKTRNLRIFPIMIGKTYNIHIGNKYHLRLIDRKMCGHLLGEFAVTRAIFEHRRKQRKKDKGLSKKKK